MNQEVEADKIFTVIGRIDTQRRWNWEKQFEAARPHLIQIIGSEKGADRFVANFLSIYDDPPRAASRPCILQGDTNPQQDRPARAEDRECSLSTGLSSASDASGRLAECTGAGEKCVSMTRL